MALTCNIKPLENPSPPLEGEGDCNPTIPSSDKNNGELDDTFVVDLVGKHFGLWLKRNVIKTISFKPGLKNTNVIRESLCYRPKATAWVS